jgi:hypothetical protein
MIQPLLEALLAELEKGTDAAALADQLERHGLGRLVPELGVVYIMELGPALNLAYRGLRDPAPDGIIRERCIMLRAWYASMRANIAREWPAEEILTIPAPPPGQLHVN